MQNGSSVIGGLLGAKVQKLPLLLAVLARDPSEFCDRIGAVMQVHRDKVWPKPVRYTSVCLEEGIGALEEFLAAPLTSLLRATDLCELEQTVTDRTNLLREKAPFGLYFNSDISLARTCYLLCRSLRPQVVIETGVAYGVNSAFLLQAVKSNGTGTVWSIDLPPLGKNADDYVGYLIPEPLRKSWHLHRGVATRVLPKLLPGIGQVDIFLHDSLHTHRNMKAEFETVWPFLRPGGVLVADDVNGNPAFSEFADCVNPLGQVVIRESHKDSMFGVLIKRM